MAAPFGPPPSWATTRTLPSGVTRERVRRSISTRRTEPSGMATGPSGKRSPDAISVNAGLIPAMVLSPVVAGKPAKASFCHDRHVDGGHSRQPGSLATHQGGEFSTLGRPDLSQALESPWVPRGI